VYRRIAELEPPEPTLKARLHGGQTKKNWAGKVAQKGRIGKAQLRRPQKDFDLGWRTASVLR